MTRLPNSVYLVPLGGGRLELYTEPVGEARLPRELPGGRWRTAVYKVHQWSLDAIARALGLPQLPAFFERAATPVR